MGRRPDRALGETALVGPEERRSPLAPVFAAPLALLASFAPFARVERAALERTGRDTLCASRASGLMASRLRVFLRTRLRLPVATLGRVWSPTRRAAGSSTVKTLPLPGALSTLISPWCASAIHLAMASPSPLPCSS